MKITNLTSETLILNDLGKEIKGVSPIDRVNRLSSAQSIYLLDTSEVLLSAQTGDIRRFVAAGKMSVNDRALAVANAGTVVMTHHFKIVPNVTVILDPTGSPIQAIVGTDITIEHDTDYNTTTITNISGGALDMDIRIG